MKIKTKISKESIFHGVSILLLFLAVSSGTFSGTVTKLAIILSMALNLFYFPKQNKMLITYYCQMNNFILSPRKFFGIIN